MNANEHMYEIVGGLRASLLSAVKKLATGNGFAINTLTPNILYMMLQGVILCLHIIRWISNSSLLHF